MPSTHNYIPLTRRAQASDDGLGETDDGFTPKQPESAPRGFHAKNKRHLLYALAAIAALMLVFAFSAPHTLAFPHWRAGGNSTTPALRGCGSSPETAAAAGCTFDLMALAWVDPACADQVLVEEFLAVEEWKWWADGEGEGELRREEVALGRHERVFVSWEYELEQCVYLWKKLQRAVDAKTSIDSFTLDPAHTAECADMLVSKERPAEGSKSGITTKYTTCGVEA